MGCLSLCSAHFFGSCCGFCCTILLVSVESERRPEAHGNASNVLSYQTWASDFQLSSKTVISGITGSSKSLSPEIFPNRREEFFPFWVMNRVCCLMPRSFILPWTVPSKENGQNLVLMGFWLWLLPPSSQDEQNMRSQSKNGSEARRIVLPDFL